MGEAAKTTAADVASPAIGAPTPSPRTVEFLRVVQQHHAQLSSMADFKANALLGVSLLIFSVSLKEIHDGRLSLALFLLMETAFASALLVLMAMLPATRQTHEPEPNLLFFGAFAQMPEAEFQDRMAVLLADEQALHRAMVRDIYQLGRVLEKKKYLRLGQAYQVFFFGLMASSAAAIAMALWQVFHR